MEKGRGDCCAEKALSRRGFLGLSVLAASGMCLPKAFGEEVGRRVFCDDWDYLRRKWREPCANPATGLEREAFREALEALVAERRGKEPWTFVKARVFALGCDRAAIGVSKHDWYPAFASWHYHRQHPIGRIHSARCREVDDATAPTGIRGKVERVKADGSVECIDIDAAWIAKHVPVSNGGLLPPPQQVLPAFDDVRAVDLKPGELVDLAPLATASYQRNYVFLVSRLGKVRFVLHQVKGKEDVAPEKKIQIRRILPDGKRAPIVQLPMPGFEPGEVSFEVRSNPGVYTLVIPSDGCPSIIDRSNVPIALDVTEANPSLYRIQERKPFSLWLGAPGGRRFAAAVGADSYYVFDVAMRDPDGTTFATGDTAATGLFVADVPDGKAKAGLWRLDFSPRQGRSCEYLRLSTGGLPGLYFLSGEKYWLPMR